VRVEVRIEEARNLPNIKSKGGVSVAPSCYVTFLGKTDLCTEIVPTSNSPAWNYAAHTSIDPQYILDSRKYLILKVWHHKKTADHNNKDPERDQVIGFVAVDLCPLRAGFPALQGWYNITDWLGKCRGQIMIAVTPLGENNLANQPLHLNESLSTMEEDQQQVKFCASAAYSEFPSHLVGYPEQIIHRLDTVHSSCSLLSEPAAAADLNGPTREWNEQFWRPPTMPAVHTTDNQTLSMLEQSLTKHLKDLGNIGRSCSPAQAEEADKQSDTTSSNNKTFVIEGKENRNPESSRTSLTSLSIEELPRDDQPNLTDLGLAFEDLDLYLGDTVTERSRLPIFHLDDLDSHSFVP